MNLKNGPPSPKGFGEAKEVKKLTERLSKVSRPSKDETFMAMAISQSRRTVCVFHHVGVVFVDSEGVVITTGYNGPSKGDDHCMDVGCAKVDGDPVTKRIKRCRGAHAELNAITHCTPERLKGSTLYITLFPCYDCMKILNNAGVVRIVFLDHYKRVVSGEEVEDEPEAWELAAKRGILIEQYKKEEKINDKAA